MNIRMFFLILSILASCIACEDGTPTTSTLISVSPECFTPYTSSPIVGAGGSTFFSGSTWGDPTVIKVGSQYIMYASSGEYTGGDPNTFDWDIKIYRFVSLDGINWTLSPSTAVFERTNPDPTVTTDWDRKSNETPSVVFFNNKYHLFYTGYPVIYNDAYAYKVGHATSLDGISWTRDPTYLLAPTDPLNATPNLDFNQWVVAEPGAIVFNNKIYLYFAASGSNLEVNTTAEVVGLVTSTDGVNWSVPQEVMRPDQSIYPRVSNFKGYSTPSPAIINNKVHLFFTVVTDTPYNHVKIHHAVSNDGVTNWVQDANAIIDKSDLAWHSNDLVGPTAHVVGSSVYLWYGGNTGTLDSLGIGLSICN